MVDYNDSNYHDDAPATTPGRSGSTRVGGSQDVADSTLRRGSNALPGMRKRGRALRWRTLIIGALLAAVVGVTVGSALGVGANAWEVTISDSEDGQTQIYARKRATHGNDYLTVACDPEGLRVYLQTDSFVADPPDSRIRTQEDTLDTPTRFEDKQLIFEADRFIDRLFGSDILQVEYSLVTGSRTSVSFALDGIDAEDVAAVAKGCR